MKQLRCIILAQSLSLGCSQIVSQGYGLLGGLSGAEGPASGLFVTWASPGTTHHMTAVYPQSQ